MCKTRALSSNGESPPGRSKWGTDYPTQINALEAPIIQWGCQSLGAARGGHQEYSSGYVEVAGRVLMLCPFVNWPRMESGGAINAPRGSLTEWGIPARRGTHLDAWDYREDIANICMEGGGDTEYSSLLPLRCSPANRVSGYYIIQRTPMLPRADQRDIRLVEAAEAEMV
ncbi:hypothetical protein C8R44DRAFT_753802 [Mycena epipterygia]|nr:hypothetical protein C8R44DRAFT_753802 [Mycena epipterygia]